jgi:hypothetical protein
MAVYPVYTNPFVMNNVDPSIVSLTYVSGPPITSVTFYKEMTDTSTLIGTVTSAPWQTTVTAYEIATGGAITIKAVVFSSPGGLSFCLRAQPCVGVPLVSYRSLFSPYRTWLSLFRQVSKVSRPRFRVLLRTCQPRLPRRPFQSRRRCPQPSLTPHRSKLAIPCSHCSRSFTPARAVVSLKTLRPGIVFSQILHPFDINHNHSDKVHLSLK